MSRVFFYIALLAEAVTGRKPGELEGLFEYPLEARWFIRANFTTKPSGSVEAWAAWVDYEGRPAVAAGPFGGCSLLLSIGGESAEAVLVRALTAELAKRGVKLPEVEAPCSTR